MRWAEARKQVEQACLDMLVQWRGDDDDDGELEEILREVIIIPDDEDDGDEKQDADKCQQPRQRSQSVEVIYASNLHTRPIDYAAANPATELERSPSLDLEPHELGHPESTLLDQNRPSEYNQHRLGQMGAERHRIWEEAVRRQKEHSKTQRASNYRLPSPILKKSDRDRRQMPQAYRIEDPHKTERSDFHPLVTSTDGKHVRLSASQDRISHHIANHKENFANPVEQVRVHFKSDS